MEPEGSLQIYRSQPQVPFLSQTKLCHTVPLDFSKIHFSRHAVLHLCLDLFI
jgi:hypothetical protein